MTRSLTPPEFAKRYGINTDKVHVFIRDGELRAIDVSQKPGGRPRWRITPEAIEEFERRRSSKTPAASPKPKRRRKTPDDVVEFV